MKLFTSLALLFLVHLTNGKKFRNDYKYYPEVERWFKLHKVPSTWDNAWLKCFREGAVLASPENDNLSFLLKSLTAQLSNSCGVYTGIHATFSKGNYHSIEGTPLSKINIAWAPGEPDNYEDHEDCLVMLKNGTVADVDCKAVYPFFCYKKKTKQAMNGCGTIDPDYTLDVRTGNCYKFHRLPQNWTQAFAACTGEGGHLAIINSEMEAQVIRELYSKYPDAAMSGNFEKYMAHIGTSDWGQRGLWLTIHGQTLNDAGYVRWGNGYPTADSVVNLNWECGTVDRNAHLANTKCNMPRPFICEKAPDSLEDDDDDSMNRPDSTNSTRSRVRRVSQPFNVLNE